MAWDLVYRCDMPAGITLHMITVHRFNMLAGITVLYISYCVPAGILDLCTVIPASMLNNVLRG